MRLDYDNKYKIDNVSKEHLLSMGFKYDKERGSAGDEIYTYHFPAYKSLGRPLLFAEISCDTSGAIIVNVCDEHGNFYPPFYSNKYGLYVRMQKIIKKNIDIELKKINAKE